MKIVGGRNPRLDDPQVEVWLPIHPNIVAVAAGEKGDANIVPLPGHTVKSFNQAVAQKSSVIVGRSEKLIKSLISECGPDEA